MKKNNSYDFSRPIRQSYVAILMIIYKYYSIIVRQLLPLVVIFFIGKNKAASWTDYIIYLGIGIAIISMVVAIVAYFRFYFHIENDELIVQQGIFNKKKTSIPFERIQTINLEQNIVHQVFQVVRVEVDTAGSDKSEFKFDALKNDMAEDLRSLILSRKSVLNKSFASEDEIHENEKAEEKIETILNIDLIQLLKIGITENHLKSGVLIFAFGWWIYDSLNEVGIDVSEYNGNLDMSPTVSLVIFLAVVFLVGSMVISLIRTVLFYFDLKFLRIGNGFRLTRGLFTKKNIAALDHKIQMVAFADNILKKILGYKDLMLKQASSIELSNKKSIKIPGCTQDHIDQVTSSLYGSRSFDNIIYHEVDKRYFIRSAIYILFFGSAIIIPGILLHQFWMWIGGGLITLYLITIAYINYRKTKFGFNHKMVVVKGGTFGDKTTLFPLYKLQSAALKQNIYQKRRDLASVVLYTASGGTSIPYISKDVAEKIINYFLYRVESDNKKWM